MVNQIKFKNLEQWQEEYIISLLVKNLDKLGFTIKTHFERSNSGLITGSVFARNLWGSIYASSEDKNILTLVGEIEDSLQNQLKKKKSKFFNRRRTKNTNAYNSKLYNQ